MDFWSAIVYVLDLQPNEKHTEIWRTAQERPNNIPTYQRVVGEKFRPPTRGLWGDEASANEAIHFRGVDRGVLAIDRLGRRHRADTMRKYYSIRVLYPMLVGSKRGQ